MHEKPAIAGPDESGVTLLEVLVGLVVSSLILAGLSLAMGTVNRGYEQLGTVIDRQGETATGLTVFDDDVSRIARVPDDPEKPLAFLFSGLPREMIYVLGERPGSNEDGLYWVRLAIRAETRAERVVRVYGTVQDITALHEAEATGV